MRSARGLVAFVAAAALSACAVAPGQPVIGTWQGSPPGPDPSYSQPITLTLYGVATASAGRYQIVKLTRGSGLGSVGARQSVWSGRWTRSIKTDNGAPRQVVYLHDALSSEINQYAVGPGNTLQPTSAYLSRDLTPREIHLFTLFPTSGAQALPAQPPPE